MKRHYDQKSNVNYWSVYLILPFVSVINPAFLFGMIPGLLSAYALCILSLLIRKNGLTIDPPTFFMSIGTTLYIFYASLSSPYLNFSQSIYQVLMLGVLPVIFILATRPISDFQLKTFFFFIAFVSFLVLAIHGLGDRGHFGGLYNSGSIFGGQASLICLITLILYMKNRSRIYIILFILFLILLILSNHRTGILALIICGFFTFFSMNGSLRHRLTLAVMSVFALVVALPYLISMLFFDNLISFNSLNSSGRFSVWPYLINEWFYEWRTVIFGGGGGLAQHILITEFDGINAGIVLPHNEFMRLGVDYGLVGIVLCFGLILRALSRYIEFSNLIALHFIIESLFSNVLFWQISYLLPMFIFLRKPMQSNGDRL